MDEQKQLGVFGGMESEEGQVGDSAMMLELPVMDADKCTENGRVYSKDAIEAALFSGGPKVQEKTLIGRFVGPGEGPFEDDPQTADAALLVLDLFSSDGGKKLSAKVQLLETSGGEMARQVGRLLEAARKERRGGLRGRFRLAPRGTGTMDSNGVVGGDYILEGIDLCWEVDDDRDQDYKAHGG